MRIFRAIVHRIITSEPAGSIAFVVHKRDVRNRIPAWFRPLRFRNTQSNTSGRQVECKDSLSSRIS
jgi:hypothetical protein